MHKIYILTKISFIISLDHVNAATWDVVSSSYRRARSCCGSPPHQPTYPWSSTVVSNWHGLCDAKVLKWSSCGNSWWDENKSVYVKAQWRPFLTVFSLVLLVLYRSERHGLFQRSEQKSKSQFELLTMSACPSEKSITCRLGQGRCAECAFQGVIRYSLLHFVTCSFMAQEENYSTNLYNYR